ncbi:MAG: serine hydrolase [Promethearchaeota archaeon]
MIFNKKKFASTLIAIAIILIIIPVVIVQNGNNHNSMIVNETDVKTRSQIGSFNEFNNFATLKGHGAGVNDIAFSSDGKYLASAGGFDGTIRIWNTSDGSFVSVLYGHTNFVYGVCFSEEGLLASTARDGTIRIWNITTETILQTLPIQEEMGNEIRFSPDGKLLISGEGKIGISGSVRIWDLTNGLIIQNLTHNDMVNAVALSPIDSNVLATACGDSSIKFWNMSTGEELREMVNHTAAVKGIAFSPDGKNLASASRDGTIKIWNTSTGTLIDTLESQEDVVLSVSFSPTGLLASGGGKFSPWPLNNANIKIWNITTGENLWTLSGHTNSIKSLDFSPDGSILASGSEDWTIKLWGDNPLIPPRASFWQTTSPEAQGMNSALINDMTDYIQQYNPLAHSFLVLRNGYLVAEQYYQTNNHIYTRDCKHYIYSCTKSITSLLVGIAIEMGYIDSVHQKVLDFFPDRNISNIDSRKEALTLEHLLTMTSGMNWAEWNIATSDPGNSYRLMVESPDWAQYVLDRPMDFDPGTVFNYNTGGSHLLSVIIQKVTGRTTLSFAQEYLFDPLNITAGDVLWFLDPSGVARGGSGLYLTPQDMAKIGYLYLQNGTWPFNGKQIVSSEWIQNATRSNPHLGSTNQYGYQVWFTSFTECNIKSYFAWGFNTQKIYIIPELDIVVVYTSEGADISRLISTFLIPSITSPVCPEQTEITTIIPSTITSKEDTKSTLETTSSAESLPRKSTFPSIFIIPLLFISLVILRRRHKK